MKLLLYCRVSTPDQTPEMQLQSLQVYCYRNGHEIAGTYIDVVTGDPKERKKGFYKYDEMWTAIRAGECEGVLVWRYDRFARSVFELSAAAKELQELGVAFLSEKDQVDTSTPVGKLFFNLLASIAEFEKEMIRERTIAGLKYARSQGVKLGGSKSKIPKTKWNRIRLLQKSGKSLREIAKEENVSIGHMSQMLRKGAA